MHLEFNALGILSVYVCVSFLLRTLEPEAGNP